MQIFISHSSRDAEKAAGMCSMLEENGHSCFIAPRNIRPGREYAEEIIDGIMGADVLLLLLSEPSNQSPHVLREVERAGSSCIPIIVYKLEEVKLTKSLEYFLMANQWIDGTEDPNYHKALEALKSLSDSGFLVKKSGKKDRTQGKRGLLTLLLLLALCGVVFAVRMTGGGGTAYADSRGQETEAVDLSLGASVELGTYNGEPVIWRVLHESEDGKQLILVSDKILTMKAFDAAQSGIYNSDGSQDYWTTAIEDRQLEEYVRGSNLWASSNIRTWLNSEKEVVLYEDQAPAASAMSEKKNGYSNEAGFLHGFAPEEREVLRETQIDTRGNVLMDADGTKTEDRVFLLSLEELDWFSEADVSIYTAPTEKAVAQDQTGWYEVQSLSYGVEEYFWLLRDPAEGSASRCQAVSTGYHAEGLVLEQLEAGAEGYGIRPAVCADKRALEELIASKGK